MSGLPAQQEPTQQEVVAVVAFTENLVIGQGGGMPWHLPADLAHFKRLTLGRPCIMGRKVWEALGGRPLPQRQNIVLTRNRQMQAQGAQLAHSPQEALALAADAPEVAILGGAEVYQLYWSQLTRLELTVIHAQLEGDTFWPSTVQELIGTGHWRITQQERRAADEENPYDMTFYTLVCTG